MPVAVSLFAMAFLSHGMAMLHGVLLDLLQEGLVDELVAGIPRDVAHNQLAVHADGTSGDLELRSIEAGLVGILADAAAEQVVGVKGRSLVLHAHEAQRLAGEKVLVRAAEPFLEDAHRHQLVDGCRGSAHVAGLEQRLERGLVKLGRNQLIELVEPGLRVIVLLQRPLSHEVSRGVEHGQLDVCVGRSEHINLPCCLYAN